MNGNIRKFKIGRFFLSIFWFDRPKKPKPPRPNWDMGGWCETARLRFGGDFNYTNRGVR